MGQPPFRKVFRRCPALPRGLPRSTIGAEELNFRVRNGTGCFPFAIAAGNSMELYPLSRSELTCLANPSILLSASRLLSREHQNIGVRPLAPAVSRELHSGRESPITRGT
jgi:hypothetical protein